jgi:hypothetical protein
MKNITLKIDESLLDRMRHAAVDDHMSVSAWVQTVIGRELHTRDLYERNRRGALRALEKGLSLGGHALTREEAHER